MLSNSNEDTDKKLAAWLKKIMPALEKELLDGPTPVYGNNSKPSRRPVKIEEYQDIDLNHLFTKLKGFSDGNHNKGSATWLSVSTQDSPVLALSVSLKVDGQNSSFVVVFEPQRSNSDSKIYWNELVSIPVKEPIEFLSTNAQNRDMFAGASRAGDLYIWTYQNIQKSSNELRVVEVFSKASEDSIVALTFLNDNRVLCCQSDGRIVVYKVVKQSTVVDKVMKIEPRNIKDPLITCIVSIPEVEDDFIVGLLNGSLLYCSTNQLVPQEETFNPVVRELQAHKFAISSLKHCQHKGKSYIISCDISSEISFHEIGDNLQKQPKMVVKLPLPLKNKIAVSSNMEHIFCPIEKGSLEVFNTISKVREAVVEGKFGGSGEVVEISRNE